jgi:serine/threonine protein kinase
LELASGNSNKEMSKCEQAYAEFARMKAKAEVIDRLSLFWQYYEKTDKFIGATKLYEIRQVKNLANGDLKAAMIFRKAEIKPETLAMIKRMWKRMITFDHPNIIKFEDSFEDSDKVYFIIEELFGGNL